MAHIEKEDNKMFSEKYSLSFDDLLETQPEILPEWREYMEPVMLETDERFFSYILTYMFL